MLSATMQSAINQQMKYEIDSAYLYLAMSAFCESKNLSGMATWLRVQWQEELEHAMKLFRHMSERGGRVVLEAVDKPQAEFTSAKALFEMVLEHEKKVTSAINKLYDLAVKENDHATQIELQWFVKEQVEEEKNASEILNMMSMAGDSGVSLLMLDRQLGQRSAK
jgi:ferritin